MQTEIWTRTCDNPACVGTGSPNPASVTIETITNGVTNRADINWVIGYTTTRSGDNTQLNAVGTPLQFCQMGCVIAYCQAAQNSNT
jgi:hypothetical protein